MTLGDVRVLCAQTKTSPAENAGEDQSCCRQHDWNYPAVKTGTTLCAFCKNYLPPGRHMTPLAKRFPLACWTSCDVLGKALPTCLLDIVWCPWQSASHLPAGHRLTSYLDLDFSCILVLNKGLKIIVFGEVNLSMRLLLKRHGASRKEFNLTCLQLWLQNEHGRMYLFTDRLVGHVHLCGQNQLLLVFSVSI